MDLRQLTEQNPLWEDKTKINQDARVLEALSKKKHKIKYSFKKENALITGPRQK